MAGFLRLCLYLLQFFFDLAAEFFEVMDGFLEILADFGVPGHFLAEAEGAFEIHRLFELVNGNLGQRAGQRNVLFGDGFQFGADLAHLPDPCTANHRQQRQAQRDDAVYLRADAYRRRACGRRRFLDGVVSLCFNFGGDVGIGSNSGHGSISQLEGQWRLKLASVSLLTRDHPDAD